MVPRGVEQGHEPGDGVQELRLDRAHVEPPRGRAGGRGVRTVGQQFADHRRVEGDADRQARPGGRRLDHPGGDREVDRHEQRVGGVVAVHLAREEHLLRALRDDAQGRIDHEGDGVGRRRLPGEQQAGHRRVTHAVRGCVPLDRGHQSGQLVRCHVRPPGRSASFAPTSLPAAGVHVHGHSHRFWTIRQELWTIGLPAPRGLGLLHVPIPEAALRVVNRYAGNRLGSPSPTEESPR